MTRSYSEEKSDYLQLESLYFIFALLSLVGLSLLQWQ